MTTRSLLLVHAHPDDETIGTGATMARYAAEGARVTLVTCTLGEEGEVRVPRYAELAADRADQLGGYRIAELAEACRALGVTDHRFLGAPGRYRDSGMMGLPANDSPRAFWQADLDEAAALLVEVIREVRPQVVVTYDPNGFYGHPDHIQAHRVAMRAVEMVRGTPDEVRKVYWTAVPRSGLAAGLEQFADAAENPFGGVTDVAELPFGTPDEEIAAEVDGTAYAAQKLAAMRAHATQIAADDWLFTIARLGGDGALGREHYVLAAGERGTADGWEDDLFAGTT
ncbi:MAG TPA: N-acetyl-1-D-myo-inositol-2-amino-2-deoxy-alpha-D-glucopyranoside deacetylase [Mycobacteriales bacterium]|jgi:N-acetyl-1-D-myo-inositol-2-amino-2-deoxy-alpha-D-glucopyranoside deacetylase